MTGKAIGGGAILLLVVVAWAVILLQSDDDPDALATITGCYAAPGQPRIIVRRDGILKFAAETVRVSGYRDKAGLSLRPEQMVMIDRQDHDRLAIDSAYPLLLRYNEAQQTLAIPGYQDHAATLFHRMPCN